MELWSLKMRLKKKTIILLKVHCSNKIHPAYCFACFRLTYCSLQSYAGRRARGWKSPAPSGRKWHHKSPGRSVGGRYTHPERPGSLGLQGAGCWTRGCWRVRWRGWWTWVWGCRMRSRSSLIELRGKQCIFK